MNLLPKSHDQFRQSEYWDGFFKRRGRRAFEWYGEYSELCGVLHRYCKTKDDILVVGCGNSTLSADLFDVGHRSLVSIDLSDVVVSQMNRQHARQRPELKFLKMDATAMEFSDGSFSCVLDKGTLDAMMTDSSDEVVARVAKMFDEVDRILRLGGRYVCVSLLQPHILQFVVDSFARDRGWPVRIVRCKEAEEGRPPEDRTFPVFAVVATKFKRMENAIPVLEMCLSADGQTSRLKTRVDLVNSVRGIQQFAAVRAGAAKSQKLFRGGDARREDVSLDLKTADSDSPKYSLFLVDRENKQSSLKFAVFIVPQGRECEWLFSTNDGRRQLAESADCFRLIVVHLNRAHSFSNLRQVQDELSAFVMELAPPELDPGAQVPFLSIGANDGSVGERSERCRGRSQFSGEYVVEDVEVGGELYRRLVFMNNPNITQSEARLKTVRSSNKKKKKVVDTSYLACKYLALMAGSVGDYIKENRRDNDDPVRCLLIGLGGGPLASFLAKNFGHQIYIDAVEIDEAIARVAKEQFGFEEGDRVKLHIENGLKFVERVAAAGSSPTPRYDVVLFDVDSKDSTVGMSCPPRSFVAEPLVAAVRHRVLKPEGKFVVNLVCRDVSLRSDVLEDIKASFDSVLAYRVPEEVSEVLFCSNLGGNAKAARNREMHSFRKVNEVVSEDFLDLTEALKLLKVV